jgi:hypothetical protein
MRMLQWICDNTRRDRVQNDDIDAGLGVAPVEEKCVQHRLKWFGHIQQRSAEAPIYNGVIRWTCNEKRGRGQPNLTWEESVKRNLKDRCITKELALDRREWKIAIHVPEPWSMVPFFIAFLSSFFPAPFHFFDLEFCCLFSFFDLVFYRTLFSPLLFRSCFVPIFLALMISSLAYPNLLGNKRLGCCWCLAFSSLCFWLYYRCHFPLP